MNIDKVRSLEFPEYGDERGHLVVVEGQKDILADAVVSVSACSNNGLGFSNNFNTAGIQFLFNTSVCIPCLNRCLCFNAFCCQRDKTELFECMEIDSDNKCHCFICLCYRLCV